MGFFTPRVKTLLLRAVVLRDGAWNWPKARVVPINAGWTAI